MPTMIQIIGLLLAMALTAWVLWPLHRRQRQLFQALTAAIPALGLALYRLLGAPVTLDPAAAPRPMAEAAANAHRRIDGERLEQALGRLQEELRRNPRQPEGWALLARAQAARGDFDDAKASFAKAIELIPDDPTLLVEAAQAGARANPGNHFDDAALALLQRALALRPDDQRARLLLGAAQRQRGDAAAAAATWQRLSSELNDPRIIASLRRQIDAARAEAGLAPLPPQAPSTNLPAAGRHALDIILHVDPALRRQFANATVFVIARVPGGPPMPVAVQRHTLSNLPQRLTLGDNDGPMPTRKLSALNEVEVFARLSRSGTPAKQEGDVDSAPIRVTLPAQAPVQLQLRR